MTRGEVNDGSSRSKRPAEARTDEDAPATCRSYSKLWLPAREIGIDTEHARRPAPEKGYRTVKSIAAIGFVLLGLWLVLVDGMPAVPPQERPDAQSIQAARRAVQQVRLAQGPAPADKRVRFDNQILQGLASLAGDISGIRRVSARVNAGIFSVQASIPVTRKHWIDATVTIIGEHEGFPELHLRAGHLTLPPRVGRWVAEAGHRLLSLRGARLPPLDQMVRSVEVTGQELIAELDLPRKTGLVDGLVGARAAEVDGDLVARAYCRLAALDRERPDEGLASQIQRAFSDEPQGNVERFNRSALVGLALYVVGQPAEVLAPSVFPTLKRCGWPRRILLAKRVDLAQHWSLSAALAAVLGDEAAAALGEWKELSDSLPRGSGFSFVDLAADRSGLHIGLLATNPSAARETAGRLGTITEEQILPGSLLDIEEGLPEQQFRTRYERLDATKYQVIIKRIDQELRRARSW
jgi:hypothetical protein